MNQRVNTFIINLKNRPDRKEHITNQFATRDEFNTKVVEAQVSEQGALGLWLTIQDIVKNLASNTDDYIIICEDDHEFTEHYSKKYLFESIIKGATEGADVLLGGVSWFSTVIEVNDNIFWVENFSGLQFMIVYKKFFDVLSNTILNDEAAADWKIGSLSNEKMIMHPFISIQKEFGYSDATINNNIPGRVSKFFESTQARFNLLNSVTNYYKTEKISYSGVDKSVYNFTIPTYIINLPARTERLSHIKSQFADKEEFDTIVIEACEDAIGALGLWQSIRKIVTLAMNKKETVIVICEDDHMFTEHYNKEYLFKNVLEAHYQGASLLSGGSGRFEYVIPITENRFWVSHCLSAQFLVIYERFFARILSEPFDDTIIADIAYSKMTSSKMVLFPFISEQKDFGYSDVTALHNKEKGAVARLFNESKERLHYIQDAYKKINGSNGQTKNG